MKSFTVAIPEIVQDQVRDQVYFIAQHSFQNAIAWEARVRQELNRLGSMPFDAVDSDASSRMGKDVRKRVFERTYLIFYTVDQASSVVEVIKFRHGAQIPRRGEP